MAMIRFNINVESKPDNTLHIKSNTCMFEGSVAEVVAMMYMLFRSIYISEVEKYGIKGLEVTHDLMRQSLDTVYRDVKQGYLKKGAAADET